LVNNILTSEQEFIFAQVVNTRTTDIENICGNFANLIMIKAKLELNIKLKDAVNLFNNHILKSNYYKQLHYSELLKELDLHAKKLTPFLINNQTFDVLRENIDFNDNHTQIAWSSWAPIIFNISTYTNCITFDIIYDAKTFDKPFIDRLLRLQQKVLSEFINNQNICFQNILDKFC
jgi:hypothetical protein